MAEVHGRLATHIGAISTVEISEVYPNDWMAADTVTRNWLDLGCFQRDSIVLPSIPKETVPCLVAQQHEPIDETTFPADGKVATITVKFLEFSDLMFAIASGNAPENFTYSTSNNQRTHSMGVVAADVPYYQVRFKGLSRTASKYFYYQAYKVKIALTEQSQIDWNLKVKYSDVTVNFELYYSDTDAKVAGWVIDDKVTSHAVTAGATDATGYTLTHGAGTELDAASLLAAGFPSTTDGLKGYPVYCVADQLSGDVNTGYVRYVQSNNVTTGVLTFNTAWDGQITTGDTFEVLHTVQG
jgi:hypothetical protein